MKFSPIPAATALAVVLAAPALADITAAEVVENMFETVRISGQPVTVGETEVDGNSIILHDWHQTASFPEFEGVSSIEWIKFTNMGDGTVDMTAAPVLDIAITPTTSYGEPETVNMQLLVEGVTHISGTYEELRFVSDLTKVELVFDFDAIKLQSENVEFRMNFDGATFDYVQSFLPDDHIALSGSTGFSSFDLAFEYTDDEKPGIVQMAMTTNAVEVGFDIDMAPIPVSGVYNSGDVLGTSSVAINDIEVNVLAENAPFGDFSAHARIDSIGGEGNTTADSAVQSAILRGMVVEMSGDDVPLGQLEYGYDSVEIGATLPVGASNEVKDISFRLALSQMWLGEGMWASFDPDQTIPRDPANFVLDISGKAQMFVDLMGLINETVSTPENGGPIAELVSFDLNEYLVEIAGARMTSSGGVRFPDNGKIGDYDMPEPVGKFTFSVQGAQTLINSLGALHMLPPEILFGAMGGIGMFSTPTGEEDSYETVVEFTKGLGIVVNGMKIQ